VSDDDWYRAARWSAKHAEAFEARLARARPENRAQYLRIQGVCLSDAGGRRERRAARELYERAEELASEQDNLFELTSIYSGLADVARADRDPDAEARHLRAALDVEEAYGGRVSTGSELRLARVIAEQQWDGRYGEADALLDAALASGLLFRDAQFAYVQTRMRLAALRGARDLAAAYARCAQALLVDNRPMAPRHPTVGLTRRRSADESELRRVARGGRADLAGPAIDAYRADDGSIDWSWELAERLHGVAAGSEQERADVANAAAGDVLRELRGVGVRIRDLPSLEGYRPADAAEARAVAPVLLAAYAATDDLDVRSAIVRALGDRRFRATAAATVVEWYAELTGPDLDWDEPAKTEAESDRRRLKDGLAQTVGVLADHRHAADLARFVSDPLHGSSRVWLVDALLRSKDDIVPVLLELVGEPWLDHAAIRALAKLRTARAEPTFAAIAAQPAPRAVANASSDEERAATWQATRVELARDGLERLEQARADGTLRP
jgi:hypothetical protein